MNRITRFTQLSEPRRQLVRLLQSINFGYLEAIGVRNGEPILDPAPTAVVEVKLDGRNEAPPELDLPDFELRHEVIRLMEEIEQVGDGRIERIDVRYGIPRRALIERPVQGERQ